MLVQIKQNHLEAGELGARYLSHLQSAGQILAYRVRPTASARRTAAEGALEAACLGMWMG